MFSKDFISAFSILSISAMSFFSLPNIPFSILSTLCNSTEQGVAMLSSVLNGERAIQVNIPNSRSDDIFCSANVGRTKGLPRLPCLPASPFELSAISFELAQSASATSWTLRVLASPLNCYETDTFYRILPLFIHQAARTPDKKPKKWLDQLIAGI